MISHSNSGEAVTRKKPIETLAVLLRGHRTDEGLSQVAFAEKYGLNLSMVQKVECGLRKYLRGVEIDQIAVAVGMDPARLWDILGLNRVWQLELRYVSLVG